MEETILNEIAKRTLERVEERKKKSSISSLRQYAESLGTDTGFPFREALAVPDISFICEVKKASPSKGIIAKEFPYLDIAKEYEEAGAAAVSVLTEPYYFLGSDSYLKEIAATVKVPVLRKDFVVDAYQIFEAKALGASAVLLICTLLEKERLKEYLNIAHSLGMSALVEAHTEQEIEEALEIGAGIIGVNNRNLKNFEVDIETSRRLRSMVPKERLFVAESGIGNAEDVARLREACVDGVLIGELLMKSSDKKKQLHLLRGK